jgi:hypothetical protein
VTSQPKKAYRIPVRKSKGVAVVMSTIVMGYLILVISCVPIYYKCSFLLVSLLI